jgi:uncharacterized membrane protein YhaH (DUF805 family)
MQPEPAVVVGSPQPAVAGGGMGGGRPAQMMGFMDSVKKCFGMYLNASGRASRSEYWWFYLFFVIVTQVSSMVITMIAVAADIMALGMLSMIVTIAVAIPGICAGIRRIHDHGKSGWFFLIPFYNLYLLIIEGQTTDNQYGPVPTNTP